MCNGGSPGGEGDAPGWFLVCEYWPGGNVVGAFRENVQAGEGMSGSGRIGGRGMGMWAVVMAVVVGGWVL